jgi:hypothetical protein
MTDYPRPITSPECHNTLSVEAGRRGAIALNRVQAR